MDPFCNIFKDFFKLSFQLRRDIKAIPRTARAIAQGQKYALLYQMLTLYSFFSVSEDGTLISSVS